MTEKKAAPIAQAQGDEAWIERVATDPMDFARHVRVIDVNHVRAYLASRPSAPVAQEPVLDKPAKVGAGIFRPGVKWSTVIGAAQRQYEYSQNPPFPAPQPQAGMGAGEVVLGVNVEAWKRAALMEFDCVDGGTVEAIPVSAFDDFVRALPAQPQEQSAAVSRHDRCPNDPDGLHTYHQGECLTCNQPRPADQSAPAAGESEGKPSWKDAPEWAQWLAQDAYGCWHWYAAEPRQGRDCLWFAPLENAKETAAFRPNPNWRAALEQRPAQEDSQ